MDTPELVNVVIDRKRWLHGEGNDNSYLKREGDGKMCCLGFASCALGVKERTLVNVKVPTQLTHTRVWDGRVTRGLDAIMLANDSNAVQWLNDGREERIQTLGPTLGFAFTFEGEY